MAGFLCFALPERFLQNNTQLTPKPQAKFQVLRDAVLSNSRWTAKPIFYWNQARLGAAGEESSSAHPLLPACIRLARLARTPQLTGPLDPLDFTPSQFPTSRTSLHRHAALGQQEFWGDCQGQLSPSISYGTAMLHVGWAQPFGMLARRRAVQAGFPRFATWAVYKTRFVTGAEPVNKE